MFYANIFVDILEIYINNFENNYFHKTIEGKGLNYYMSTPRGPCADNQLGLWIEANSVENVTQSSRYKRAESYLLADEKGPIIESR